MNKLIDEILKDLYKIDKSFKENEKELKVLIKKLLSNKPNPKKLSLDFKQNLLNEMIRHLNKTKQDPINYFNLFYNTFFMKKLAPIAISFALVMVVIISGLNFIRFDKSLNDQNENLQKLLSNEIQIQKNNKENAFGEFEITQDQVSSNERSQSGGGGGFSESATMDAKMIAPYPPFPPYGEMKNYIYKFDGTLPQTDSKIDVLKKTKIIDNTTTGEVFLEKVTLGIINKEILKNTKVDSFSLYEDRKNGYSFYVNLNAGEVSINRNWQNWDPQPQSNCTDEACFNKYRLKLSDIPEDSTLISIANKFLADYEIDTKNYGTPSVNRDFMIQYEREQNKEFFYIPEIVNVVYPFTVNGMEVYDQWGNKVGMNVTINIRDKKVDSVWGIKTQNFETSTYDKESEEKIKEIIETGGVDGYSIKGPNIKDVEIKLNNPKLVYMNFFKYQGNTSDEFLIPAIKLDINAPKDEYSFDYRKHLIIPLLKDIYKFRQDGNIKEPRPF